MMMNKIKEFLKRTRLTSWHIYGVIMLYAFIIFVFDGYISGYEGYLERRTALTLEEFESLLTWLTVFSFIMISDLVMSIYLWHEETKKD